ncbi:MAG: hydroxymethylbilane synthase [Nitrospirota bacterium]
MKKRIVIGTRGSKLALYQAEFISSELKRLYPDFEIELCKIKTTGDKILDVPLAKVGGKGLFVKEIEEALLKNEVDIAVHSMKDVPTEFPDGLHLAVICKREDPRDALIINQKSRVRSQESNPPLPSGNPPTPPLEKGGEGGFESMGHGGITKSLIYDLPNDATIGTSSLRRSCQLLNIRPDLKIQQLRGNLDTRIRKLDEGQFNAIILAAAGVKRLGLKDRITEILPVDISLPAIGQGAIGVECRVNDEVINNLIALLNHPETSLCVRAERAFLKRLEGGCQVPIAAYARIINNPPTPPLVKGGEGGLLIMDGLVGSISGDRVIKGHIEGNPEHAESLGITLAEDILSRGALEILNEVYGRNLSD